QTLIDEDRPVRPEGAQGPQDEEIDGHQEELDTRDVHASAEEVTKMRADECQRLVIRCIGLSRGGGGAAGEPTGDRGRGARGRSAYGRQGTAAVSRVAMATALFESGAPDVPYLVDLSSYVLRAYHAIAPLSSPSGEPTHAVHGVVNMLERLFRERQPRLVGVAMDAGRMTFRQEIYPEYKAHRPPAPDDLKVQMTRCEEIVRAYGLAVFKQEGVEADDLIASAVRRATEQGLRVVIVGADKDLMQLVSPTVILWDTMRDRVFGPDEVLERF